MRNLSEYIAAVPLANVHCRRDTERGVDSSHVIQGSYDMEVCVSGGVAASSALSSCHRRDEVLTICSDMSAGL